MLGSEPPRSRTTPPAAPSAPAPRPPSRWTRGHLPGEVGIWVFILGDLLAFGLFFGVFMVQRGDDPAVFAAGRESLSTTFGAVNTLLLLTGSILIVLAMAAVRTGQRELAPRLIVAAMGTGLLFVVNKGLEYADKIAAGQTPNESDFFLLFFAFTAIHLLHLVLGVGALAYMHALARRPQPADGDVATMESCAAFWHLVDLLWVVLFALLYLVA